MIEWYRSWPRKVPEHLQDRPRIVDTMPRLPMDDWEYLTVALWPESDFCLLEWDVALDRWDRETFVLFALESPQEVAVAPYRISDGRNITGMGCIYLPREVLTDYLATKPLRFTDHYFFEWYKVYDARPLRVCYNVHPQHLNT